MRDKKKVKQKRSFVAQPIDDLRVREKRGKKEGKKRKEKEAGNHILPEL
jgi:hypothetical protein